MNIYQENILDHYQHPRHFGALPAPVVSHPIKNPLCGDELQLYVSNNSSNELTIRFEGSGCAISVAAASILLEETNGQSLDQVRAFADQDMQEALGVPLSPARLKCGLLALSGLREAISQIPEYSESK